MTVPHKHVRRLADRRGLTDEVYDVLIDMLMEQAMEPGQRVSIDGLARELQVSQTPLRESLARLAAEGLVERHPGRGYIVTSLLGPDEMDRLFEYRMAVEPRAARLAAERTDVADRTEITRADEQCAASALAVSDDDLRSFRHFSDADARLHALIATASRNAFLADAIIRIRAHRHLHRAQRQTRAVLDAVAEHRLIVDAVDAGEPTAAEQAMTDHLTASHGRFRQTTG